MSGWAALYLIALGLIGVSSAFGLASRGGSFWTAAPDVFSTAGLVLLVGAYFEPGVSARLGRWAFPLLLAVVLWEFHSMRRDRHVVREDLGRLPPEVRPAMRAIAFVLLALYYGPALTLALLAIGRQR
jgi:hypothetical protein